LSFRNQQRFQVLNEYQLRWRRDNKGIFPVDILAGNFMKRLTIIFNIPTRKEASHETITGHSQFYGFSKNELLKKNTVKNYSLFLNKFNTRFNNQEIETISSDEILSLP